ncbi:MAG TPA: CxxxxCH/CxxCH domain-containing protein, partial [Anaeromyxobacteraceae bacterium]|nr:CxxxxCH/CxxCH domain-containing protein [Anaeromyxobacteraceae bacterium]
MNVRMPSRGLALVAVVGSLALAGCTGRTTGEPASSGACVGCHDSGSSSAPPVSAHRAVATADPGVGAHQAHVNPGPFRKAVSCEECHPVPQSLTSPGHNDGKTDVVFGGLAIARGAAPVFDPGTPATPPRCSAAYCHGGTLHGGSNTAPQWNKVDGTQVACGTCHGVPPLWAGHPPMCPPPTPGAPCVPATAPSTAACNLCHPGTVRADGSLDVPGGRHIDGLLQVGAQACTTCHGDVNRTPIQLAPAPPRDTAPDGLGTSGNTATTALGVGAHQKHLTGTSLRGSPIACSECHVVPGSLASHPKPRTPTPLPEMTWGPLATAGGATPRWDRGAATCSATYCHGGTLPGGMVAAPTWTGVMDGTQVQCGSCHGLPPVFGGHPPMCPPPNAGDPCVAVTTPPTASCNECHGGTVKNDGTLDLASGLHIDGWVELDTGTGVTTCTSCHGDPNKPATIHAAPPRDISGNTSTAAEGVGAHDQHLTGTSLRSSPVACAECHPAVTRTDHSAGGAFEVVMIWGPLATTGGSWPVWNPGTLTCSSTYCHGSTLAGGTIGAPLWTTVNGTQAACGACHGIPPPDPHLLRQDCGTCHAGYTSSSVNLATHLDGKVDATGGSCTSCHGDPSRTPGAIAAAPPVNAGTAASPWAASDPGAHQKHLAGTLLRSQPITCAECHRVPTGPPAPPGAGDTHGDGAATVVFGALSSTGGGNPAFDPGTLGCSATYCHGGADAAWGGTRTAPVWNVVDGTYSACGTCHANPPATTSQLNPATGLPGIHPDVAAAQNCNGCHTGTNGVQGSPISVNPTLHMNGVVNSTDGSGSCASCHGDPRRIRASGQDARIASAPPANAKLGPGATPPWDGVDPGAHLAHLTGTTLRTNPIACNECHTVPTTSDATATHRNGTANVAFGSLSKTNGLVPTWNTTIPAGCATTYCHGDGMASGGGTVTRPTWNGGPTQATCGTCHATPPPDTTHTPLVSGTTCASCHTGYGGAVGGAAGTFTVDKAVHLNGVIDATGGSCTSCHGTSTRVLVTGADPQTAAAPPAVSAPGPYTADAAADPNNAHSRHLNHAPATAISDPTACSECHLTPSTPPAGGADSHGNTLADIVFG